LAYPKFRKIFCLVSLPPFVVPDDEHGHALVRGGAGHDGVVVGKPPVTVDLHEVGEQQACVLEHARAGRVPGHLHALPRRQVAVNVGPDRLRAAAEALDAGLPLGGGRQHRQRLDLLPEDANGLFELEKIWHVTLAVTVHRSPLTVPARMLPDRAAPATCEPSRVNGERYLR
jgi:hypothetical protein